MKKTIACALASFSMALFAAENLINVSWGDNIMVGSGISKLDTPEKIAESRAVWNDAYDGKNIMWRVSSEVIAHEYESRSLNDFQKAYNAKVASVEAIFNPVAAAKEAAKKNGQDFYIYLTFLDHGAPTTIYYGDSAVFPWQDKEFIKHPEYNEVALDGTRQYGVPDLSNDNFRKMMIARLMNYVKKYQPDGLYLCSRTHSNPALHGDQFGFSPKIVAEYKSRYGIDITKDKRFDYKSPEFAPNSIEVQRWRDLRGEYLVLFLKELRQALGDTKLILGVPRGKTLQAPYGNMTVDKKTIIENNLVDGIMTAVYSSKGLYPRRTTPHGKLGYLESDEEHYNVPAPEEEVAILKSYAKNNKDFKVYYNIYNYNNTDIKGVNGYMFVSPVCQPTPVVKEKGGLYSKSFTVEGFFRVKKEQGDFSKYSRLVSKYAHTVASMRGWEVYCTPQGNVAFRTNLIDAKGNRNDLTMTTQKAIVHDKWVHIACVLDDVKKEKRIYINGELAGTQNFDKTYYLYNNKDVDLVVANYCHIYDARVMIDELRMTTDADFKGVPTKPYTGKEPGTIFLFHFDEVKEKVKTPKGVVVQYLATPVFSEGVFGKAIDLTKID